MLQDFIFTQQQNISGHLGIWAALYLEKKLIYISFKFKCFYNSDTGNNIFKIVIPLDVIRYLKILLKKILSKLFSVFKNKNKKEKNEILNEQNWDEISKKIVAFIPHKGLMFATGGRKGFEKTLYYSEDANSSLNKYNILHIDYSNHPNSEKNICWVCLNKIKFSNVLIFLKTLLA